MDNYDICVIAAPEDAAIAETLAQSIRTPGNPVKKPYVFTTCWFPLTI